MRPFAAACAALALSAVASADYATQTDWSGGGGVGGPVSQWDSTYSEAEAVNRYLPGSLGLGIVPEMSEHIPLIPSGALAHDPLWGDIDLDGDLDLLAVGAGSDSVFWCEQPDEPGLPWPLHHIAVIPDISSLALIGDGFHAPSFAVNYKEGDDSAVYRYYRYGPGDWNSWYVGSLGDPGYITGVAAGDVDGNGIPDIVGWKEAYDEVVVWWNCSPGTPETIITPHTPLGVFIFDGDCDGDCELAVDKAWYPETEVFWNDGGTWTPATLPEFYGQDDIDAGDLDGDGVSEITGVGYSTQYLFWKNGTWEGGVILESSSLCAFARLDDDGDTDLVGFSSGDFQLLYNLDEGQVFYPAELETGFYANHLEYADMDGDGSRDLILTGKSTGQYRRFEPAAAHPPEGLLESSILYLGCDPGWDQLDWTASTPPGTSVAFQVRSSDDPADMGEWSDTLQTPGGLSGILEENDSYFQYRALLSTSDQDTTPVLEAVTVSWNPLGTSEPDAQRGPRTGLLPVSPNPSPGRVSIRYALAGAAPVELRIYDVSGRLADGAAWKSRAAGSHRYVARGLPSGVYVCRLICGGSVSSRRFVILR
ncbi:MAG: T9SS type A sorting domain-containing protein [Candidatus Fermentibacteraceae bacterium]